jgi:predicted glycoside hydrolase/deacetylase ChbG (UPF0249 family)
MRTLIVNADDFGRSAGVNRGIERAHEEGIVTSASLMVRWPDAVDAGAYVQRRSSLGVGLHCDLGEWVCVDGEWHAVYEVVSLVDSAAVTAEVARQMERFHSLTGMAPTHLDSHQHVHRKEPVRSVLLEIGNRLGIPVRLLDAEIRYCGDFYGQSAEGTRMTDNIGADALVRIISSIDHGVTELACHPAETADFASPYSEERAMELQSLCDIRVRRAIEAGNIRLASFGAYRLEAEEVIR